MADDNGAPRPTGEPAGASPRMARALQLAGTANHGTSPNPMVGALLEKDGEVVAEAYHRLAGEPHAEVLALRAAGARAVGSTMYVTLEPCAHEGRTGPCAAAVAEAGVRRVVAAMEDPDPRVAGRGVAWLRRAGVDVEVGDGAAGAEALNPRWLAARRAGRAFCALKFAMTLDGKIATTARQARWVTGEAARAEAHRLRRAYEAVAVGARTVTEDDPRLTAREADGSESARQPLRVVVDGRLSVGADARVFAGGEPGTLVVASRPAAAHAAALEALGARVVAVGDDPRVPFASVLQLLAAEGVHSVLLEGGGEVAWSAVEAGVVDHVYAFVAPTIAGGAGAPTPVGGEGFAALADALGLRFVATRTLGADVLLEAVPA